MKVKVTREEMRRILCLPMNEISDETELEGEPILENGKIVIADKPKKIEEIDIGVLISQADSHIALKINEVIKYINSHE